jgi:hypothetical protein
VEGVLLAAGQQSGANCTRCMVSRFSENLSLSLSLYSKLLTWISVCIIVAIVALNCCKVCPDVKITCKSIPGLYVTIPYRVSSDLRNFLPCGSQKSVLHLNVTDLSIISDVIALFLSQGRKIVLFGLPVSTLCLITQVFVFVLYRSACLFSLHHYFFSRG